MEKTIEDYRETVRWYESLPALWREDCEEYLYALWIVSQFELFTLAKGRRWKNHIIEKQNKASNYFFYNEDRTKSDASINLIKMNKEVNNFIMHYYFNVNTC